MYPACMIDLFGAELSSMVEMKEGGDIRKKRPKMRAPKLGRDGPNPQFGPSLARGLHNFDLEFDQICPSSAKLSRNGPLWPEFERMLAEPLQTRATLARSGPRERV